MAKYRKLIGQTAIDQASEGDVVVIMPGESDYEYDHASFGWVWGLYIDGYNIEVVAVSAASLEFILENWCNSNTESTIENDDTVRLYKPENAPKKFWVWLAQKRLNNDSIVTY